MAHQPLHLDALGATRAAFTRSFAGPELLSWLVANLLAERERWLLWLPVGLGTGIAAYFALPLEPPLWLGAAGLLLATLLLAWSGWRLSADAFQSCAPGLLGLVVVLLGFTVATLRTDLVDAPVLDRRAAYNLEATVLQRLRFTAQERLLDVAERGDPDAFHLLQARDQLITATADTADRIRAAEADDGQANIIVGTDHARR